MERESMFSEGEIEEMLPGLINDLCPFTLTQKGSHYQVEYRPHGTESKELFIIGHGSWSLHVFARWFHRGDRINGMHFDDWYKTQGGVEISHGTLEQLL